jgi:hypothetical protein
LFPSRINYLTTGLQYPHHQVLTTFGYGKTLDLAIVTDKSDAVHPKVGLSQRANAYFGEIFDAFDADGDGVLSPKEQDQLFGSFPDAQFMSIIAPGMAFEKTKTGITRGGFLSFWNYVAIVDPRAVVEGALYSGLDASEQAIIDGFFDGQGQDSVKTVQCTLFCHNDSCRDSHAISSLLANLVNLPATEIAGHGGACGALTPEELQAAYSQTDAASRQSPAYLALDFSVDKSETLPHVGAFVFDWATCTCEQFSALVDAMVSVASSSNDSLPCVLIGLSEKTKDDQLLRHVEAACEGCVRHAREGRPGTGDVHPRDAHAGRHKAAQEVRRQGDDVCRDRLRARGGLFRGVPELPNESECFVVGSVSEKQIIHDAIHSAFPRPDVYHLPCVPARNVRIGYS